MNLTQVAKIASRKGYGIDWQASTVRLEDFSAEDRKLLAPQAAHKGRRATRAHPSAKYAGVLRCRLPGAFEAVSWRNEEDFSREVARWRDANIARMPELMLFWHNPNENSHTKAGVLAGVPDWTLAVPRGKYAHLYIELKVGRGDLSDMQQTRLCLLQGRGNCCVVVWDSLQAVTEEVEGYLYGQA